MSKYEDTLFSYFEAVKFQLQSAPLNLGGIAGSGGGIGGPAGGFIGVLPQTKIAYDYTETEAITSGESILISGESLLDNLNKIRYRIRTVENLIESGEVGGTVTIENNGVEIDPAVTIVDFTTNLKATQIVEGEVEVKVVGTTDEAIPFVGSGIDNEFAEDADNLYYKSADQVFGSRSVRIGRKDLFGVSDIKLDIFGEDEALAYARIVAFGGAGTGYPFLSLVHSRGTADASTASQDSDILGGVVARGHDGVSFEAASRARFYFKANGEHTETSHGTKAEIWLTPVDSITPEQVVSIDTDTFNVLKDLQVGTSLTITDTYASLLQPLTIQTNNDSVALVVQAYSDIQTSSLQEWRNAAGTDWLAKIFSVTGGFESKGDIVAGGYGYWMKSFGYPQRFYIGHTLEGAPGILVDSDGNVRFHGATTYAESDVIISTAGAAPDYLDTTRLLFSGGAAVTDGYLYNTHFKVDESSSFELPEYAKASLPTAEASGRIARVTDSTRGIWMDQGSQWFALNNEIINVKEFGATGDGVTDDTAAIAAAFAVADDGDTVFFPKGHYYVSDTFTITSKHINLKGFGKGSQIFQSADKDLFVYDGTGEPSTCLSGIDISDLFLGSAATTAGTCLLKLIRVNNSNFSNIFLLGSYYGIHLNGCLIPTLTNIRGSVNISGFFETPSTNQCWIYLDKNSSVPAFAPNASRLYNLVLEGGVRGLYMESEGEGGISIYGGTLEGLSGTAIEIHDNQIPSIISGIHFENYGGVDIVIDTCTNVAIGGTSGSILAIGLVSIINSEHITIADSYINQLEIDETSFNIIVSNVKYNSQGDGYVQDYGINTVLENLTDSTYGGFTLNNYAKGMSTPNPIEVGYNGGLEHWNAGLPLGFYNLNWAGHTASITQTGDGCADTNKRFGAYAAKIVGYNQEHTGIYCILPSGYRDQLVSVEYNIKQISGISRVELWTDGGLNVQSIYVASGGGNWQRVSASFDGYTDEYSEAWVVFKFPNGASGYIDNVKLYVQGMSDPSVSNLLALTTPLASTSGGTGTNNAGTLTIPVNTSITGGGTIALGGYTLTVPATGTAVLGTGTVNYVAYWSGTNALAGSANLYWDNTNARLGIGVTPGNNLHVYGTGASYATGPVTQITLDDSNAAAIGNGGGISFRSNRGTSGIAATGALKVGKENSTNDDVASYMSFYTRVSAGSLTERMRITSTGQVEMASGLYIGGIGTAPSANTLQFVDAGNIVLGTSTGTKIGTATSQKLGFWNVTPIIQPAGATQVAPAAYATGAYGLDSDAHMQALYDLVVAIRTALVNAGIMKGAA